MSRQVIATLLSRCGVADSGVGLTQFLPDGDEYISRATDVSLADRPPMVSLRPRLSALRGLA
jgi:glucosyl-3-phosphoglycerate synthase